MIARARGRVASTERSPPEPPTKGCVEVKSMTSGHMKMTQGLFGLEVEEVRHEKVTVEATHEDLRTC